VVFGLTILLLVIGAGAVFATTRGLGNKAPAAISGVAATATATQTATLPATATPTITLTPTLQATWTPEPPIQYKVASGNTCLSIALAYGVSVDSIVTLNKLSPDCTLSVGQTLNIPRPTPTASPAPSNTPNATEAAQAECNKVEVVVKDGDTMGGIAANYAVSANSIIAYNGKTNDTVYVGEKLVIPLCEQHLETVTPTANPPYGAPPLLLPADGAFYNATDVITLQWASVGELRQNEAYAVTIEDVTSGDARKWVEYVTDTKYNIPDSYRPASTTPHIYRWSILTVRQTGTDKDSGKAIWAPAGDSSVQRVFSWIGTGSNPPPTATETPKP
jgi:LysM repeat protein